MQDSSPSDISLLGGLPVQQTLWYCCSLRLAFLFDAPLEVKERILADGDAFADGAAMVIFGNEWRFLLAVHLIQTNRKDARILEIREHLCMTPLSQ